MGTVRKWLEFLHRIPLVIEYCPAASHPSLNRVPALIDRTRLRLSFVLYLPPETIAILETDLNFDRTMQGIRYMCLACNGGDEGWYALLQFVLKVTRHVIQHSGTGITKESCRNRSQRIRKKLVDFGLRHNGKETVKRVSKRLCGFPHEC